MSQKFKLALTRGRLFELDNTVTFFGKFNDAFDENKAEAAIKRLGLAEPVITSSIELCDDSSAYIVTDEVSPLVELSELTKAQLCTCFEENPLIFFEKCFRFFYTADGYLFIAGHTAVCDAKSLLRLAMLFADFYSGKKLNAPEDKIFTFSEPKSLPVDVISPLTNKLSSELDNKWHKESRKFTKEDYVSSCESYKQLRGEIGVVCSEFSAKEIQELREYCKNKGVDLSSLVYFAFYKSFLSSNCDSKTISKMLVCADRRYFHGFKENYFVGAYNGTVNVSLNKKELKKAEEEQLKLFHLDTYRALTSPFRVFYDDVLFMQIEPALCDASFVALAGEYKSKFIENFSKTYGCKDEVLCECLYCNLNQQYWESLGFYSDICAFEPFKWRSLATLTFSETAYGGKLYFKYKKEKTDESTANTIVNKAVSFMKNLLK